MGQIFADQIFPFNIEFLYLGLYQPLKKGLAYFPVLFGQHLTGLRINHFMGGPLAQQDFRIKIFFKLLPFNGNLFGPVKEPQQLFSCIAEGLKQGGDRKLPPPVDTHVEYILDIKLKIDP